MFEVCREFNLFVGLLLMLLFSNCYVGNEVNDFISPPTTVKARENNTVLLPCYLNTLSNGELLHFIIFVFILILAFSNKQKNMHIYVLHSELTKNGN